MFENPRKDPQLESDEIRRREAEALGLSPDATWEEIEAAKEVLGPAQKGPRGAAAA